MLNSEKQYTLTTTASPTGLAEQFARLTHIKQPWGSSIPLAFTGKKFTGQVNNDGFFVIASGRAGLLCNFKGVFAEIEGSTTQIIITAQLQKVFRNLYWI